MAPPQRTRGLRQPGRTGGRGVRHKRIAGPRDRPAPHPAPLPPPSPVPFKPPQWCRLSRPDRLRPRSTHRVLSPREHEAQRLRFRSLRIIPLFDRSDHPSVPTLPSGTAPRAGAVRDAATAAPAESRREASWTVSSTVLRLHPNAAILRPPTAGLPPPPNLLIKGGESSPLAPVGKQAPSRALPAPPLLGARPGRRAGPSRSLPGQARPSAPKCCQRRGTDEAPAPPRP
jgi:hypothetical protein